MIEESECCETCRFWSTAGIVGDGDVPGNSGECRRHAPRLVMAQTPALLATFVTNCDGERDDGGEEDARRIFPLTYPHDWCGEHRPLPPPAGGQ